MPRDRWLAEAAERFTALNAWRRAHPEATWAEIRAAADAQAAPPRARVLGDTAMAAAAAYARCPICGAGLSPPR